MNDRSKSSDLKEASNSLKENLNESPPQKRNLWYVDVDLRKQFGLRFVEAAFFAMIQQLQCPKHGFCWAKNYYFMDALGLSDKWIERALRKLSELNLIWIHYYHTQQGLRRQIVTAVSIRPYQEFLKRTKNWSLLKKFHKEFVIIPNPFDDPNDPKKEVPIAVPEPVSPPLKNAAQVVEPIPSDITFRKPSDEVSIPAVDKVSDTINTTYLPNRKNGVTCKTSAAAFFEDARKELEQSFSKEEVTLALKWYEIQTPARKERMENPIACMVDAIQKGYCREKVLEHEEVMAEQEAEKHERIHKVKTKKRELSENEKFAHRILKEYQRTEGFSHRIDSACVVISNDLLEKHRDEETGAPYFKMPSGEKYFNVKAAVRINFNEPSTVFKKEIKKFLVLNKWIPKDLRRIG
jgi:hypothetical protein